MKEIDPLALFMPHLATLPCNSDAFLIYNLIFFVVLMLILSIPHSRTVRITPGITDQTLLTPPVSPPAIESKDTAIKAAAASTSTAPVLITPRPASAAPTRRSDTRRSDTRSSDSRHSISESHNAGFYLSQASFFQANMVSDGSRSRHRRESANENLLVAAPWRLLRIKSFSGNSLDIISSQLCPFSLLPY